MFEFIYGTSITLGQETLIYYTHQVVLSKQGVMDTTLKTCGRLEETIANSNIKVRITTIWCYINQYLLSDTFNMFRSTRLKYT